MAMTGGEGRGINLDGGCKSWRSSDWLDFIVTNFVAKCKLFALSFKWNAFVHFVYEYILL